MRISLGICVAVALLAGCGGSQPPVNGPAAVAPMAHSAHLTVISARPFTGSCDYSVYITCVTVAKGSPAQIKLCYNSTGSGCASGSFPVVKWYALEGIRSIKRDKHEKWLTWKFRPNPGNPIEDTITTLRSVKNSHGVLIYFQAVEACINGCPYKPYSAVIGIATK